MSVAGYVLAGGNSTRMGKDKALLKAGGTTLAQQTAFVVQFAAGSVTLVGDPAKYAALGFPVIPDLRPGSGPLAGMEAALLHSTAEWNLIVACDLVSLHGEFLQRLCATALDLPAEVDCLVPVSPDGRLQPLSAMYRRQCREAFSRALDANRCKVTEAVNALNAQTWQTGDPQMFQNVNTPEEWTRYVNGLINQ